MDKSGNQTILVVDDQPEIVNSVRRIFYKEPLLDVLTANSGAEALMLFDENDIDLILTDQKMPGMTGVELLREISIISPDTIKIILSGFSELDTVLSAINEVGVFKFIMKPWDNNDLKITIQRSLEMQHLIKTNRMLLEQVRKKESAIQSLKIKYPQIFHVDKDVDGNVIVEE